MKKPKQPTRRWLVPLNREQLALLSSAVDSHLYEQAGNNEWPVNSGFVLDPRMNRIKSDGPLTDEQLEICETIDAHDAVEEILNEFLRAEDEEVKSS